MFIKKPRLHTYAIFYRTDLSRKKAIKKIKNSFNINNKKEFRKFFHYWRKPGRSYGTYYLQLKAQSKKDYVEKMESLKKNNDIEIDIKKVKRRIYFSYW